MVRQRDREGCPDLSLAAIAGAMGISWIARPAMGCPSWEKSLVLGLDRRRPLQRRRWRRSESATVFSSGAGRSGHGQDCG